MGGRHTTALFLYMPRFAHLKERGRTEMRESEKQLLSRAVLPERVSVISTSKTEEKNLRRLPINRRERRLRVGGRQMPRKCLPNETGRDTSKSNLQIFDDLKRKKVQC